MGYPAVSEPCPAHILHQGLARKCWGPCAVSPDLTPVNTIAAARFPLEAGDGHRCSWCWAYTGHAWKWGCPQWSLHANPHDWWSQPLALQSVGARVVSCGGHRLWGTQNPHPSPPTLCLWFGTKLPSVGGLVLGPVPSGHTTGKELRAQECFSCPHTVPHTVTISLCPRLPCWGRPLSI